MIHRYRLGANSFLTIAAPFITNLACSSVVMSCSGSPLTATMFANFPGGKFPDFVKPPHQVAPPDCAHRILLTARRRLYSVRAKTEK